MRKLIPHVVNFLKGEDGPTTVEYAIMLALIIVACIGAIHTLGHDSSGTYRHVATKVSST
jgi:pilus assembly protein Flp/PilA